VSLMEKARLPVILSYRLPKINVSILANAFLKERGSLGHAGGWFKVGGFFLGNFGNIQRFLRFLSTRPRGFSEGGRERDVVNKNSATLR
jgi:hypothetical protein